MFSLSFKSFFQDLFTVEGAGVGDYALNFLPYLITALSAGVLLAAIAFTLWRVIESKMLTRLRDAGATSASDAKSLSELGYAEGKLKTKFLRFLLRSHSCVIYKNVSSSELDDLRLAFMREAGMVSSPQDAQAEAPDAAPAEAPDAASSDAPAEPYDEPAAEQNPHRARRERPRLRMTVGPDTRFYILPSRLSYVEEQTKKDDTDEYWGLLYSSVGVLILWFCLLLLLDPVIGLFLK